MFNKSIINQLSILSLTLFIFSACDSGSSSPVVQSTMKQDYSEITVTQAELLKSINRARSEARDCYPNDPLKGEMPAVPPLTWNSQLYASALEHSTDLAMSDTFSHDGSGTEYDITGDGEPSKFYERILANGYSSNYRAVGENIAGGQKSIEEVMEAWLESPGHCVNIMSEKYSEVGVAIVTNRDSVYGIYWTQNFGSNH